jgi:D-xylose 1-dehydrogenase (NADP+, D-xylono-1,5-lactone-forming)
VLRQSPTRRCFRRSRRPPRAGPTRSPAAGAERAAALAAKHGIGRWYGSYDELLADDAVDGVYVALSNAQHRRWTAAALERGKRVLCEKPLALTAAEAREIDAAAAATGRLAMEAFMYRFDDQTRAFVASVGRPRYAHAAASFVPADPSDIRLDTALGGGALLDLGCYAVDAVRWLLGEPESVTAIAHVDGVDRSVAATLGFADGALATLWASFEVPPCQELAIVGADGYARTSHRPFASYFDPSVPDRFAPQRTMVDAFVDAALAGRPPPIPLSESIATLSVLDRIRASAGIAGGSGQGTGTSPALV